MRNILAASGFVAILGGALTGCTTSGVGDPCVLETVPQAGFFREEVYVETSSVQCRTRVCLVHHLRGNPRHVIGEDSCPCVDGSIPMINDAGLASCELLYRDCIAPDEIENRMHCSCRCGLLPGVTSTLPLCECPSGYACEGENTRGGDATEGKYCIPEGIAKRP